MQRTPVIISTDPGVDDIVAILFALASPELEILAYIPSFGNTDSESAYSNILKAYAAIARHLEQFPGDATRFPNFSPSVRPILARGSDGPLQGDLHSAQYFHGRDGLGGITERHPELTPDGLEYVTLTLKSGMEVVVDLIQSRPSRTITYIALGPLTDLANLMEVNAGLIREKIGRIVCMGGNLDVPGNTTPVAEFNFFADPFAVKKLLIEDEMLLPLDRFIMLPLDITTSHELPFPTYKERVDPHFETSARPSIPSAKSPLVHFTSSFLEQARVVMLQFGKDAMELHDIVAVWCAISNPPVLDNSLAVGWRTHNRVFDVERTGELTRGCLVVDRRADEGAYALGADRSTSSVMPALVETEDAPRDLKGNGVACCTRTPGPSVLLEMLLSRVWGV
ncbi:Inosine-uridine preferring nucleoside hydrolase [Mycena indigotica]|uniref:Inosine-uridine preferring nucleoside hydrolase n=1 Tax=Mycena indigotica TaxID=2126181 RepID=A0A8H6WK23_9AGAR|nr:Inosine-uridine preferring nucleoside hydrolase [Mycena indigotica]KAF7315264.1 Inosine-uridine preferring nucleoside hydrolase [Mycena indigotica]